MSALTTRNTITMADGTRYRVRTRDELALVAGPVTMVEREPGEWYERDGPTIAWFVLTPYGWLHKETGQVDMDSCRLALCILKDPS